jgi:acetyl esterase
MKLIRPPEIPPELRTLMSEIGPRWGVNRPQNIQTMIERFSDVLRRFPRDDIEATRNVSYGPHPRQELDVHRSGRSAGRLAAVLFVHGGAFMDGHRTRGGACLETPERCSSRQRNGSRSGTVPDSR